MENSPSLLPSLLPMLPGLIVALGGITGIWLSRRETPARVSLLVAQTDTERAETGKRVAERESLAVNTLSKALTDADRVIDRLRDERDDLKAQIERLLKEQEERHEMANKLYILQMKWAFMEGGMSFEEANGKVIAPLYPMEGNEASE